MLEGHLLGGLRLTLSCLNLLVKKRSYIVEVGTDVDSPDEVVVFKVKKARMVGQVGSKISGTLYYAFEVRFQVTLAVNCNSRYRYS
jgi:hypothetical protein